MTNSRENLKAVMDYFAISNSQLAKALCVDPSLVSRWITGERRLKASSTVMDTLTEYILARSQRVHDIEWLNVQFEKDGLPTGLSSVYQTKQNLIMWLASDGEGLRRNLGKTPSVPGAQKNANIKIAAHSASGSNGAVMIGCLELAIALEPLLGDLPDKSGVDIFLSNDELETVVSEDFSRLLLHMIEEKRLQVRLLVCISGNTHAMSRIIDTYMQSLVSGHIQLSVVHGMTQTVTNQMHLIIPGKAVVLVTETPKSAASPVAVIVKEEPFVRETYLSFERTARYAQLVLNVYGDNFSRNILEILYLEFAMSGGLDIVKDSINPMYMPADTYDRFLRTRAHSTPEYEWRSAEFGRFKSGMDENLKNGTVFREIISLYRLNQIIEHGSCKMPGLYFMERGVIELDAWGCAAILNGYIHYLKTVPSFNLLILDDIPMLHADSCWHLKQGRHVAFNQWGGDEPVMIHSDQLLLIREFQMHFDSLWMQGEGCIGNRSGVIAALQDVLRRLTQRHMNIGNH